MALRLSERALKLRHARVQHVMGLLAHSLLREVPLHAERKKHCCVGSALLTKNPQTQH